MIGITSYGHYEYGYGERYDVISGRFQDTISFSHLNFRIIKAKLLTVLGVTTANFKFKDIFIKTISRATNTLNAIARNLRSEIN